MYSWNQVESTLLRWLAKCVNYKSGGVVITYKITTPINYHCHLLQEGLAYTTSIVCGN